MRSRSLALSAFALLAVACSLQTVGTGTNDEPGTSNEPNEPNDPRQPFASSDAQTPKHKHAVTNCDVDGDGVKSWICGGPDCCDVDPYSKPGVTDFHAEPNACGSWDWNCDGKVEQETAPAKCTEGFLSCSGKGFEVDTPCGQVGRYYTCGYFLGCTKENQTTRPQRCK